MAKDPFQQQEQPDERQLEPPLREADEPMSLPDDVSNIDDTHQQTDTNVDSDEAYHEGAAEASEVSNIERAKPDEIIDNP